MIVDDSAETRQCIRMLLAMAEDIEVVAEAENGAEALKKLAVMAPDVVLMDINMPVLNGVEATERICRQYPAVSVIVLSVQNDVEYVRCCMRAGARHYLFKPVTADTLVQTVRSVNGSERDPNQRQPVTDLEQTRRC